MKPPSSGIPVVFLAVLAAGGGCRGGCGGAARGGGGGSAALLDTLPAETQVVVGLDFARVRAAPLWAKLAPLTTADPADGRRLEEFARRTGFDPLKQTDALVAAFPEQANRHGEMALVLRGHGLDESRLVAYARDQVGRDKPGDDLFSFQRAGRTLWAARSEPTTAGFFTGADQLVIGAGGWAEKMAELAAPGHRPGGAASGNRVLVDLVGRAGPGHAVWAAALVPAATREELRKNPELATAAGINHLAAWIDVGADLDARLFADLPTPAEAAALAAQVEAAVKQAKRTPQVLLLGIAAYLDGVHARADGVSCQISLHLPGAEVAELGGRLKAAVDLMRRGAPPGFP